MIISFAYSLDQMVFYADGFHIKHGRIAGVKWIGHAEYLIDGLWINERLTNAVHKELITSLFHRP